MQRLVLLSLFVNCISFNFNLTRKGIIRAPLLAHIIAKDMSQYHEFVPNVSITNDGESEAENEINLDKTNFIKVKDNVVRFYGPVNKLSCLQLQFVLNEFEDNNNTEIIHLHIQSNGGELVSAFYVSDYIKNMKIPVYTYIDSFAASAATVLSIVGKKRFMSENSLVLIHQLSTQISGSFNQINTEVANLDTIMGLTRNIYLKNSKMDLETLDNLLSTNLWLNSTKALELGIVDKII